MLDSIDPQTIDQQPNNLINALQTITLIGQRTISFVVYRKHTWHGSGIIYCHLSPKSMRDEIKEELGLKMTLSSPFHMVYKTPYYILELYIYIYI